MLRASSPLHLQKDYSLLPVRDTGCGMTPAVREKIFEPSFTTKDVNKGTGLGSAVIHGIVRDHGFEIIVESESGKGSAFAVLLPLAGKKVGLQRLVSESARS